MAKGIIVWPPSKMRGRRKRIWTPCNEDKAELYASTFRSGKSYIIYGKQVTKGLPE